MSALCLSIVTVTKDDPAGLARTLSSAARWRAVGVEHVVVDGSTDQTAIDRELANVEDSIQVVRRPPCGVADAFNAGFAEAHGDWVWFVNGGDSVHEQLKPDWLLELLGNTSADVVIGGIHYDDETVPRPAPPMAKQWPVLENWLPHPSTIVRREVIQSAGGFDVRFRIAMDFDLWQRILRRDRIVDVVSVPFARFDINGVSQQAASRKVVECENACAVWNRIAERIADCLWLIARLSRVMLRVVYRKLRPRL